MIININQTIVNLLNEDRTIKSSRTTETYILTPDAGKKIINIKTGETFKNTVSIGTKANIKDFKEVNL